MRALLRKIVIASALLSYGCIPQSLKKMPNITHTNRDIGAPLRPPYGPVVQELYRPGVQRMSDFQKPGCNIYQINQINQE